jgi:hypothetical protein
MLGTFACSFDSSGAGSRAGQTESGAMETTETSSTREAQTDGSETAATGDPFDTGDATDDGDDTHATSSDTGEDERVALEDARAVLRAQRGDVRLQRVQTGGARLHEVGRAGAARHRLQSQRAGPREEVEDPRSLEIGFQDRQPGVAHVLGGGTDAAVRRRGQVPPR